jgi:hypothetical protein
MTATIARLDTDATDTAAGYDPVMREVILADGDGDGIGESLRQETEVLIPVQVENDRDEQQRMMGSGDVPQSAVVLIVHLRDMERLGLRDSSRPGGIVLKKGDRLVRIQDKAGTVRDFPVAAKGGYYCTHVRLADGFVGGRANLSYLSFAERPQGVTR